MAVLESMKKIAKTKEGNAQEVEFTYYAPGAKKVCLAGKFNDWNTRSLPMKKDKDGVWKTAVRLSPGRYEYKFFVDGVWTPEHPGSDTVLNPYGTYNRVIGVK